MATTVTKINVRDIVSSHIFETIEALLAQGNKIEWQRPWSVDSSIGAPYNLGTNRPYSRSNFLILQMQLMLKGYGHNAWLTFKQVQQFGGHVRKGEKGTPIVFFRKTKEEKDDPDTSEAVTETKSLLRYYVVFNFAQVEGLNIAPTEQEKPTVKFATVEELEQMVRNAGASIEHIAQDRAYYNVTMDKIVMPLLEQFQGSDGYYSTLFHELSHWTGHASRLNRGLNLTLRKKPSQYAYEELVAELASVFLSQELGYQTAELSQNSAVYLSHYYELLKENKTAFLSAAWAAGRAADYLLRFR